MTDWNTDMEAAPLCRPLLVQYMDRSFDVVQGGARDYSQIIAWAEIEPYVPEKPEQVKDWKEAELCVFESAITPAFTDSVVEMIKMVEQRTREIVAWEQKHGA